MTESAQTEIYDADYAVLYCKSYGGFNISTEGCLHILEKFPEKLHLFGFDAMSNKEIMEGIDERGSYSHDIRDDQDIIKFMLDVGLVRFQGKSCTLDIRYFPIYKGIRIPYGIREYDGQERLYLDINYESIARDLSMLSYNNPLTAHIIEHGFDVVTSDIKKQYLLKPR